MGRIRGGRWGCQFRCRKGRTPGEDFRGGLAMYAQGFGVVDHILDPGLVQVVRVPAAGPSFIKNLPSQGGESTMPASWS